MLLAIDQIIQTHTQYSMPLTDLTTVDQIIQSQTQYSMPLTNLTIVEQVIWYPKQTIQFETQITHKFKKGMLGIQQTMKITKTSNTL